jgi:hypothetical protein
MSGEKVEVAPAGGLGTGLGRALGHRRSQKFSKFDVALMPRLGGPRVYLVPSCSWVTPSHTPSGPNRTPMWYAPPADVCIHCRSVLPPAIAVWLVGEPTAATMSSFVRPRSTPAAANLVLSCFAGGGLGLAPARAEASTKAPITSAQIKTLLLSKASLPSCGGRRCIASPRHPYVPLGATAEAGCWKPGGTPQARTPLGRGPKAEALDIRGRHPAAVWRPVVPNRGFHAPLPSVAGAAAW